MTTLAIVATAYAVVAIVGLVVVVALGRAAAQGDAQLRQPEACGGSCPCGAWSEGETPCPTPEGRPACASS